MVARQGYSHGRGIESSKKGKIRIGVHHLLLAVLALTLLILFFSARLIQINSTEISASGGELSPKVQTYNVIENKDSNNVVTSNINNGASDDGKNSFHFIVSSDCTSYQRWEILTQLHSAQSIQQCGRFTWIVSGCLEEGSGHLGKGKGGAKSDILTPITLLEEVQRHFPHLTISNHTIANSMGRNASIATTQGTDCSTVNPHVHFTPDYSNMRVYGGPFADGKKKRVFINRQGKPLHGSYGNTYKFNNKPNGLHHWVVNYWKQDDRDDEAIVLIDPDFLFLNKFELPKNAHPVLPGKPAAAKYGLGGQFLDFNLTNICTSSPALEKRSSGESKVCPFTSITNSDVNHFYSAGPPYIIHIQDVLALSRRWSDLVPSTYDEYPLLYAEMFAYEMASADLGLKHNLLQGLFTGCMTHWPRTNGKGESDALKASAKTYAHAIENGQDGIVQRSQGANSCFLSPLSPPPFLHYCSRYSFETPYLAKGGDVTPTYHFFAKRKVDHDIFDDCNKQPLEPFISQKPEKIEGGQKDWNVLVVCSLVRAINFAKRRGCESKES